MNKDPAAFNKRHTVKFRVARNPAWRHTNWCYSADVLLEDGFPGNFSLLYAFEDVRIDQQRPAFAFLFATSHR